MSDDENAIVEAFGGNLPTEFDPTALMQSTANLPASTDKPYLTFKDGEWTYGAEANECDPSSLWAVNPVSFKFGYIEWLDSKAGGELLVPMGQPYSQSDLVLQFDPENTDHRIAPQIAVELMCLSGDDEGLEVLYKTSTPWWCGRAQQSCAGDRQARTQQPGGSRSVGRA